MPSGSLCCTMLPEHEDGGDTESAASLEGCLLMYPTRLLLAENHGPLAGLLKETLLGEPGLELIGEAVNAQAALALLAEARPDVVILDLNLPDMCGLEAIPLLLEGMPSAKVLLLTDQDDQRYQQAAARNGASACVRKDRIASDLVPAVRRALRF